MDQEDQHYDYIIAGGGLAGLSLAYRMAQDPWFDSKSILILDKVDKNSNDRTWCFWTKEEGLFDHLRKHEWKQISYNSTGFHKAYAITPYTYKMIRSKDFYQHCLNMLRQKPNVQMRQEQIISLTEGFGKGVVKTAQTSYTADKIFQSFRKEFNSKKAHFVWQHFKGLLIRTLENTFDSDTATLMDFDIDQGGETRFMYVLPTSNKEALVEFTIFSKTVHSSEYYDPFLKNYITSNLGIKDYEILEEELGQIPMTTMSFELAQHGHIIPIGTNNGSVKASSGYAFTRVQREVKDLISALKTDSPHHSPTNRYLLYDKIMLNAILSGKTTGKAVFDSLFKRLSPKTIFKFLDEQGTIIHDMKIFTAPPKIPFIKAFIEEILK